MFIYLAVFRCDDSVCIKPVKREPETLSFWFRFRNDAGPEQEPLYRFAELRDPFHAGSYSDYTPRNESIEALETEVRGTCF